MAVLFDKLRGFFATNSNWNLLAGTRKKFTFPSSIKTDEDPSEIWEIIGDIGDGAFGKIFKVQNKETGLFSALKQVNVDDEADLGQYSVEVIILSELKHPNVVGMYEAFYYNAKFWMYLEYCSVGAVDNIIHDLEHGLSEPQIQSISKQMCTGLQFLHDSGVIHRDLKAGNVLITSEGIVKLADFGVSAKCSSAEAKRSTFLGTPYWMAPEVIACETATDNPYDFRADIWSFGITIIEFAQMDPPYNKMNPARVAIKIMRGDPPTLDQPKKWSTELNDFIAKCLQKDPSSRLVMSQLLQHPFLRDVESNLPIMQLISEAKADVTIECCDVDSQDDLSSLSNSNSAEELGVPSSSANSPASEKASPRSNDAAAAVNGDSSSAPMKKNVSAKSLNGHIEKTSSNLSIELKEEFSSSPDLSKKKNNRSVAGSQKDVDEEVQELSLAIHDDEEESSERQPSTVDTSGWPTNGFHGGKFGTKPSQRLLAQSGGAAVGGFNDSFVTQSPDGVSSSTAFDRGSGRYRSLTKTRSYVYEGKVITHQTSKIVVSGDENRQQEEHQTRKANFRALKLLQFTENRKLELFHQRVLIQKEAIERQHEQELKESLKRYSADCEHLAKSQKQEIERLEAKQSMGHRNLARSLKEQQEKDLRAFQDSLKRELRIVKRESSGAQKNVQRRLLEQKEVEFAESERKYREHQEEMMARALERLSAKHRNEMAALEAGLLEEKHQLLRAYEGELWTLEEKRLEQRTEFEKLQIKHLYGLHKELATFRHSQELDQVKRVHDQDLMKLRQKIMADNKDVAKRQKIQYRKEQQQLKDALRSSAQSSEQEREALKEFEEKAKKKMREETGRQDAKNKQTLDSFEREHAAYVSELKELSADRLRELEDQMKTRLHDENERHRSELMEWHFNLSSRKQLLEEEFTWQIAEQRRFYGQVGIPSATPSFHSAPPPPSSQGQQTTSSWMNSDNHISTAL